MEARPRIALVTGAEMAKPDPETRHLVAALAQLGIEADIVPWSDPVNWAAWPLVVVRTPWDYFRRLPEFLAWAEVTHRLTRFVNPYNVIAWNCHKQYLRALAADGIPTVPTLWLDQGCSDAREQLAARGWGEVVVKPAVSIGAIGALRADAADPACLAHLDRLVEEGDVMVQPFVASVAEAGEVSLVYFGGRFSHAIRKQPAAGDFRVQDMYGGTVHPHQPTGAELAVADAVLARTPAPTTYARIDLVEFAGAPALMEAELIEPELFLGATPEAAMNFARVLQAALRAEA